MKTWNLVASACTLLTALAAPGGAQPTQLLADIFVDGGYPGTVGTGNDPAFRFATVRDKALFWARQGPVAVTDGTPLGTQLLPVDLIGGCTFPQRLRLGSSGGVFFWLDCIEDNGLSVLWRSDGTPDGTFQLTNPNTIYVPTRLTSANEPPEDATYAFVGGVLYFQGCRPAADCALWRTDGTIEGTRSTDVHAPGPLAGVGGKLFFAGYDGESFLALTDGTAAGTVRLRGFSTSGPRRLTVLGGKLLFLAGDDGEDELWVSDGTAAGTRAVSHFAPSEPFELTKWLKVIHDKAYFLADDGEHGIEIWRSDGTPGGTERVTEISLDDAFHEDMLPEHLEEATGGRLVFLATDDLVSYKLFATSGSPASTTPLTDVCGGSCHGSDAQGVDSSLSLARTTGGRLVFRRPGPEQVEVWSTDGTPAGTVKLASLLSGKPVALLGSVFFGTLGTPSPYRLWRTDGTIAGTAVLTELPRDVELSREQREMATVGGRVLFQARSRYYGLEVWSSDAQTGSTEVLGNLSPDLVAGSGPTGVAGLGSEIFFRASSRTSRSERRIWHSGGTAETTVEVPGIPTPGCSSDGLGAPFRVGARIYYVAPGNGCQRALWTTDGSVAGTLPLAVLPPGAFEWAELQGQLVFVVWDSGSAALWRSDGTPAGTLEAFAFPAAVGPASLTAVGQSLYFLASNQSDNTLSAWISDGTLAGTRPLAALEGFFYEGFEPLFTGAGNLVFFRSPYAPGALWRTDGTSEGTMQVLPSDLSDGPAEGLAAFGGDLYFFQLINGEGDALFRTDGTAAGTVRLHTFTSGYFVAHPHSPTVLGDRLLFAADDGLHGRELWSTDGTSAGTSLVRDIFPGEPGSLPGSFTVAAGRLFFEANDGAHGIELWQSDGTRAGTRLVQDLNPGVASSSALPFPAVGDRLYFGADDGLRGYELWFLPLGSTGPCQPSDTHLCLSGGRFRVEAQWKDSLGRVGSGHAVALSADTGYFWFFSSTNVEAILKILDGRALNDHFWVFYGALSNVEYSLTVTDTQTGLARRYFNSQGALASIGDTQAFGPRGAHGTSTASGTGGPLRVAKGRDADAATGTCQPAPARLCLAGGRFAVEATWKDFAGRTGVGTAVELTADTGYFWFFGPENVEVVLKVLDGAFVNGHFWVFYGALSNVEYALTVTDTTTGSTRTYRNPSGRFASVADVAAF